MTNDRPWLPYALILPSVAFLALLFVVPLVQTVWLALSENGAPSLANIRTMAGDINFARSVQNTFLLALAVIPVQIAIALAMGTLVSKIGAGRETILWIWTIPLGISDLAAGMVWLAILQNTGYLNSLLFGLGLIERQTAWLTYQTPVALFIGIAIAEIWRGTAIVMVIIVAGLNQVPKEFREAAEVFGAGPWTRFWRITLPLIRPALQSALILRTVLAFEVFAVVYALGGRNFPVLVGEAYAWQNQNQNYGVAAAYAVLIMVISLAATLVYLKIVKVDPERLP
ncbi:sugar ABC transporter permease [Shinella yambaruensis]|uniref:Sugar ABC transporter permease n=1 Tax=Shinella yambaruensis TaxID=415996 RepID=A0ABQ5ZCQ6_9HYPH|nr:MULTISPECIES: sugar ABC transporter permease [Shinella]CAI0334744.1 ABC transporter permease [Rhizobiaceae bacterium]CAK7260171.1 ABC transporter permease [Shinella sp. WSC3-e]MCJ8029321.1 sugar ABC transporter permease [Shinella yambaruensis]MCO5139591.1 sugar ABC transporter permease [Shinella sp.]MCU7983830.1 sugar ABC transporter permease [Shinella yambaruensis]